MSSSDNGTTGRPGEAASKPAPGSRTAAAPAIGLVAPPAALVSAPNMFALLRALRRRWVLATSLGLSLGATAAVAVWFLLPPAKNTANVQLMMNADETGVVHAHPEKVENFDSYQSKQIYLIKSRLVLNTALRYPGIAQLTVLRNATEPLEFLEKEVRVDFPSREILRITVPGEDVEELKTLANAISKAYLTEIVEKQTKDRQTRLEELRKIQARYKEKLASNRRVKLELAKKTGTADSKTNALYMMTLHEELKSARTRLVETKDKIRELEVVSQIRTANPDRPVPERMIAAYVETQLPVNRIQIIRQLEEKLAEGEKRAKDPNLPGLQQLRTQIETQKLLLMQDRSRIRPEVEGRMRETIAQQADMDANALKTSLTHHKAFERSLQGDIDRYSRAIEDSPGAQLSFSELEFDIEQAETEVRTVTAAINNLEVEMNDPPRVRPLQEAVGYKVDNFARKAQMAGVAGVAMLGLTMAGIALLEFRSRRVNTVDEVTQGLGVRVVGTVPACPRKARGGSSGKASYWKSILAESVDAARTLLLHHARREDLRIIMVTSATGGEGKTSLSSHLAVSMARSGRKTLLIDCDLRNPSAHKLFNVPLEPGLSSLLRGEATVEDALHPTQASGLWLMPAGACDGDALRMLAQDGVQPVFDRLRSDFDFIVVDSSPVLPVADSLMVAQQVDGVLFAILREVSRLPKVHEAYQKLVALGVRMLGAVVNGTSSELYGYGYGYGYGQTNNRAGYLAASTKSSSTNGEANGEAKSAQQ
jgi:polysaccharide biosynthesis transport protein